MLELNKIYLWDCLDLMKQIPDKSIDLVLTDPPYWIGASWKNFIRKGKQRGNSKCVSWIRYDDDDWDSFTPTKEYFDEIMRVSKNAIIFWWNYFIENLSNSSCWIVWDKNNWANLYADCELARTNFNTAVRMYKYTRHGMIQEDMWNKEVREHPTQKPVALFKWILENYSEPWMTILDPFLWSWTTAIACKQMNRNFIGIEREEKYVDIANKRLKYTQVWLF